MTSSSVLVLNCGSSSIKLALIDPATGRRHISGLAERLGTDEAVLTLDVDGARSTTALSDSSYAGVLDTALPLCQRWSEDNGAPIVAVGHRVVHGGSRFTESVLLDEDVLADLEAVSRLAPLHNPANLQGIRAACSSLPAVPQVAVFDTAFHSTMPEHAYRYAVPADWYTELSVRRYGFHGTSHRYVSEVAAAVLDRPVEGLRLVTAHLGNGCSVAAVRDGLSLDTSMGLTPLEGLVMGTRSGDLDPGIFNYLEQVSGHCGADVLAALNTASGLLGLSGLSNDMRTVRRHAEEGHEGARLAIEVFCYRLAKYIASYGVPLGGVDAVVFTGGIGENDKDVRASVLGLLGYLGFQVDEAANAAGPSRPGRIITTPGTAPAALVVPTDEELVIARDALLLADNRLAAELHVREPAAHSE